MSEEHDKDPAGYPLTHSYEDQMRSIGEGRLSSLANCVAEEIKRLKARAEKAEAELAEREKALEQLLVISTGIFAGSMESQGVDISDSMAKERVLKMISIAHERHGLPELAEWLLNREK